nr:EOG090X0KP6 [Cyclestheria hislopi]
MPNAINDPFQCASMELNDNKSHSIFTLDSDDSDNNTSVGDILKVDKEVVRNTELTELEKKTEGQASQNETSELDTNQSKSSGDVTAKLTAAQRAKMERNRQKAILLKQARLMSHPYNRVNSTDHSIIRVQNSRLIDSGGGFLIDEKDLQEQHNLEIKITQNPAPIIQPERPPCEECQQPIHDSFLFRSFHHSVCDTCRDDEEKHSLITRTDARQEYLLKDCDLDSREPKLRYILRKNPHNPRWGDMKLYLKLQVEKRAIEIWGSMEKIEEERNLRDAKREKNKVNKFNKQIKALRMAVRSSVYRKQSDSHVHNFGPEQCDPQQDFYYRICQTCEYKQTYEKM